MKVSYLSIAPLAVGTAWCVRCFDRASAVGARSVGRTFRSPYGVLRGKIACARSGVQPARCARTFSTNRIVKDQLERASLSVVLNIAEGGGRRSRRDKARFYTMARGSATEVAALMDVLERRHLAPVAAIRNGGRQAIRIVQMLTRVDQKLRA